MSYWVTYITVVLAVALADMCWTMYFIETENRAAIKAGVWSSLIMVVGAYTTTTYVSDKSYVSAAAIGAFLGTTLIVWWKRKKA